MERLEIPAPRVDAGIVVRGAFGWDPGVRSVIHHGKYRGSRSALGVLGDLMGQRCPPASWQRPDALVAVPLGPHRERERGYNQAEVLGVAAAARLGLPFARGLVRVRDTRPQVGRGQAERAGNLDGAFAWTHSAPPPPMVWIVDDVLTTGATARACVTALTDAGCLRAEVLVVALAALRADERGSAGMPTGTAV